MKAALTADVHLTTRERNPERFQVFESILTGMAAADIRTLIIAGDLFDSSVQNVAEFEAVCGREEFRDLKIIIVPGNHDLGLNNSYFSQQNLAVISEPALVRLADDAMPILFVPYQVNTNMGEVISSFANQVQPEKWVLVGHGDWMSGLQATNPYEPGVYMPLTRKDVEAFRPAAVFLGHIHVPTDQPPIYYPGSPCGLDITETGYRRILVSDLSNGRIDEMAVDTPILFFNETFTVLPVENEETYLRQEFEERKKAWNLKPGDERKVQLRLRLKGYSSDRSRLGALVEESFSGFTFYKGEEPDLSEVSMALDSERNYIANSVRAKIEELASTLGPNAPSQDEILLDALHLIYGK